MQRYLDLTEREAHEGLRIKWALVPDKLDYRVKISVSWLLGIQDPLGFWDARGPWLSGVVIRTLILAKPKVHEFGDQIDSAIKKGIEWLVSDDVIVRQPHGGLAWDPNLGTWDTAVILRALLAAGYSDRSIINGVKNWMHDQAARSYFGSTTVPFGESYPAQTFQALEEAGETIYSKGVGRDFRKNQLEDGSWGDHFNTAEVLQYLTLHRDDNAEAISKALSYIERTQSLNGTWSSLTWPTAVTLIAYLKLAKNPYSMTTIRALEYLSGQQHLNGSWFHLLADTTFATEALVMAIDLLDFERFDFVTGDDFKMSSISVVPETAISPQLYRNDMVQINRRVFNGFRVGFGFVAIVLFYVVIKPLIGGWSTLEWAQRFEIIFKLIAAILASLLGIFAPLMIKVVEKRTKR
ncbi:MAG: prenyltransferase/squalene oxidase repeat-containing protein [Chloroflexota bacterium]